ncbi:hypothetical protein B0J17DRAFT_351854 [Rhizoctonia solani]|nr:hypothetical protein B0J17DRAFT_351854 [Rhizoctonia solani]
MSALVGGSGNSTYTKSRTTGREKREEIDSSEDSSNDEVKGVTPEEHWHDPRLETHNARLSQSKKNTQVDFRPTGPRVVEEYPLAETSTQADEYGLGREAKLWKTYVKETDNWDGELVDGWNKSLDVLLVFVSSHIITHVGCAT